MSNLLTREQWAALRKLYIAGRRGIKHDGTAYGDAGPWPVLMQLRDHNPPLMREVFRVGTDKQMKYLVVITEAGERFYEDHEKLHDLFYPSE